MGLRFHRRIKLGKGVTLNVNKKSASISIGRRGAKMTFGRHGRRTTVGIPGTGLFYTIHTPKKKTSSSKSSKKRTHASRSSSHVTKQKTARQVSEFSRSGEPKGNPPPPKRNALVPYLEAMESLQADMKSTPESDSMCRLALNFLERLVTPSAERHFVDGCREYLTNHPVRALNALADGNTADGNFLAGCIALQRSLYHDAEEYFLKAWEKRQGIGKLFEKYDVNLNVSMVITPTIVAHLTPSSNAILLGLVESCQQQGNTESAVKAAKALWRQSTSDPVALLSVVELVVEHNKPSRQTLRNVLEWTSDVTNDSAIHTAILYYRCCAMARLGDEERAIQLLAELLRNSSGRGDDLRAQLYLLRSTLRRKREDVRGADADYNRACQLDPCVSLSS
jgi:tetratricopeptide (TPR) repeat protein